MATKVKLPPNTWMDQVINLGLDKTIPFGAVNVVYDKATGKPVGFIRYNKFYKMGEKTDKPNSPANPEVGFSVDDLNKKLPDGGIDPAHAHDYLNSSVPELADAAQKIVAMQSLRLWDNKGKPTNAKNPSDFSAFGKIVVTQADVDKKVAEINQQKQSQATSSFNDQKKANDTAKASGKALPFPNLTQPAVAPVTSVQGLPASGTTSIMPQVAPTVSPTATSTTSPTYKGPKGISTGTPKVVPPKATSGTTGNTGSASGNPPAGAVWDGKKWTVPKTPVLSQEDFLAKYSTTLAFINSDPSLKALFDKARDSKWDGPRFQVELRNSAWAKKYAAGAQLQEISRTQTPSTWVQTFNNMREHIARTAVKMGDNALSATDLGTEATLTNLNRQDATITQWAIEHKDDANFEEELQKHIALKSQVNLALPGGQAASDMMKLKAYAGQMGLGSMALAGGADYFSNAAQSILLGKSTSETWQAQLLQQAKDKYKAFAPSLDAGQTVQSLAAPYINTLANLLEITPDQVDLSASTGYGKMVNDALTGIDPANPTPIPLYQFEQQVKSRPEWGKTNNARDTIMGGVNDLLKSFGKVS